MEAKNAEEIPASPSAGGSGKRGLGQGVIWGIVLTGASVAASLVAQPLSELLSLRVDRLFVGLWAGVLGLGVVFFIVIKAWQLRAVWMPGCFGLCGIVLLLSSGELPEDVVMMAALLLLLCASWALNASALLVPDRVPPSASLVTFAATVAFVMAWAMGIADAVEPLTLAGAALTVGLGVPLVMSALRYDAPRRKLPTEEAQP